MMHGQASMLRQMLELERSDFPEPDASVPVILIGSGKGGVGKTVCAILSASELARMGGKVLLVDGDLNLANLHVLLGARPSVNLERVLYEEVDPGELVQRVDSNLWLLAGASGSEAIQGLGLHDRARLHHRLSGLFGQFDAVVIDGGAGLESVLRVTTMNPTCLVIVTSPEPAALADAYAVIKLAHFQSAGLETGLVINRCLDDSEGEAAYLKLSEATENFLGRKVEMFAAVPEDLAVLRAVRQPRGLLGESHSSPGIAAFRAMSSTHLHGPAMALDVQSVFPSKS